MVTQCVLCSLYSPVRWSVTLHSTNGWERFKNKNHFNLNKWVSHHPSVGTAADRGRAGCQGTRRNHNISWGGIFKDWQGQYDWQQSWQFLILWAQNRRKVYEWDLMRTSWQILSDSEALEGGARSQWDIWINYTVLGATLNTASISIVSSEWDWGHVRMGSVMSLTGCTNTWWMDTQYLLQPSSAASEVRPSLSVGDPFD